MSIKEEVLKKMGLPLYQKQIYTEEYLDIEKAIDLTIKKQKEEILQKIENKIEAWKRINGDKLTKMRVSLIVQDFEDLKKEIEK